MGGLEESSKEKQPCFDENGGRSEIFKREPRVWLVQWEVGYLLTKNNFTFR